MTAVTLGIAPPGEAEAVLGEAIFDEPIEELAGDVGGELSVDTVRGVLEVVGMTLHEMIGDEAAGDEHWRFSSDELDLLAPAVLRIAMRRPKLRQAIEHGDEMTVALILAGYAGRNIEATRVARKDSHGDVGGQAEGAAPGAGPAPGAGESVFARLRHGWEGDGARVDGDAPGDGGQGR